jgi:hypothetical protein
MAKTTKIDPKPLDGKSYLTNRKTNALQEAQRKALEAKHALEKVQLQHKHIKANAPKRQVRTK